MKSSRIACRASRLLRQLEVVDTKVDVLLNVFKSALLLVRKRLNESKAPLRAESSSAS